MHMPRPPTGRRTACREARRRRQAGTTVLEYAILLAVFAGVFLAGATVLGEDVAEVIRALGARVPAVAAGIGAPST